jgi:peptidoglycan/xylan/chitin deacetylase (PgdA/CDA1 family)
MMYPVTERAAFRARAARRLRLGAVGPLLLALAPPALVAQAQPVPQTAAKPGWQWTMDSVTTVVNAVRAGRSLQPAAWPGNARVAVLLSFDVDNETIALRFGEPNAGSLSQGQYGARQGLARVVRLLDRHQIPATFFIPSVSLALAPAMADVIKRSGRHEFGVHGWIHELNTTLPDSAERALLTKAVAELTRMTGTRPTGYRAPSWNFSPNTLSILRDLGFRYESSLMADDSPYELLQNGAPTGLVELPVEWILDDAPLFDPRGDRYSPPRDVARVWMDEFDKAYEEGTMIVLTLHPHISGHRSRIVALEQLLAHIASKGTGRVWFATHGDAAEYVRTAAKLGEPRAR